MGSDSSPQVLFEGALEAASQLDSAFKLMVIGTHSAIQQLDHKEEGLRTKRMEFYSVSDAITMADEPIKAASKKTRSSLVVGIRLLKKRKLHAFVSAGNTGALMTSATLQLPKLPGIKRPALLAVLPTLTGSIAVLDIGGNVSCKTDHLLQFALMGAAFQSCYEGIDIPRIGLLNIGIEPKKGNSAIRQAYQALSEQSHSVSPKFHFVGNVEGREVFTGIADVLVTDGFTGNVLLKTSEGVSSFIFDYMKEILDRSSDPQLQKAFEELKRYFSHSEYPGAFLCGIEGVVVKCHGNASSKALLNSIKGAVKLVETQVVNKLKDFLIQDNESSIPQCL